MLDERPCALLYDFEAMVLENVEKFTSRFDPLRRAVLWVFTEKNYARYGDTVERLLTSTYENAVIFKDSEGKKAGILKTHGLTETYVFEALRRLGADEHGRLMVCLHKNVTTGNCSTPDASVRSLIDSLRRRMYTYEKVDGKFTGKIDGARDDMLIVFFMCLTMPTIGKRHHTRWSKVTRKIRERRTATGRLRV